MHTALQSGIQRHQHDPLPCIQLVSVDAAGVACPLPAELGPLPLYQDDDDFYSVLGPPLSHTTPGGDEANEPASTNIGNTLAYQRINISAALTPHRGVVFCGSSRCSGNRFDPFKTKQALNRHYEVIHLGERLDCPVLGCNNVGEKGIKRLDNLVAHLKNQHGALLAEGSNGDWLIRRVVGQGATGNHAL
ncbi:hypothetical protein HOY80DRAFT_999730 [Tuber brumale]|nr:hypothetical protein HOY80DRAFT_999730 [Tuber brumale]